MEIHVDNHSYNTDDLSSRTIKTGEVIWRRPWDNYSPPPYTPHPPYKGEDWGQGCSHSFAFHMYIPPGQTVTLTCPICGAPRQVTGGGAIWC